MGCLMEPAPVEPEPPEAGPPSRPNLPDGVVKLPLRQRLKAIQQFISSLEYNYTPETYFNIRKKRPLKRIVDTGRQIVRDALPIKCVEAVFLAIVLTSDLDVYRIPLGFKTAIDGQEFRHIVLIVRHGGKYGALGISRRKELMYKDLVYDSLAAIVTDFKQSYERWWHTVLKIRVGLPIEHDVHSQNQICWRYLMLKVSKTPWEECCAVLDAHAACAGRLWDKWVVSQAKISQSKKQDAAKADRKGRISPDSEPDNVGGSVLSDSPVISPKGNARAVPRRFKRPFQNGGRKAAGTGMVVVKSAPDLLDADAGFVGAAEQPVINHLRLESSINMPAEPRTRESVDSTPALAVRIPNGRNGKDLEEGTSESESESDSEGPCSPLAKENRSMG